MRGMRTKKNPDNMCKGRVTSSPPTCTELTTKVLRTCQVCAYNAVLTVGTLSVTTVLKLHDVVVLDVAFYLAERRAISTGREVIAHVVDDAEVVRFALSNVLTERTHKSLPASYNCYKHC